MSHGIRDASGGLVLELAMFVVVTSLGHSTTCGPESKPCLVIRVS